MDLLPDAPGALVEPNFAVKESVLDILTQNGGSVEHPSFEEIRCDAYVSRKSRPTPSRPYAEQCSVPVPCSATTCPASAAACAGGSSDGAAMLVAADAGGGDGRESQSDAAGSFVARFSYWLRGTDART